MKTKTFKFLFYQIALLCICLTFSKAQTSTCGTVTSKAQMLADLANQQQQERGLFFPNRCLGKTLSVTIHIVKDSTGNPGITLPAIQAALQLLNTDFAPICLSFQICQTLYIDNFNYDKFKYSIHDLEMRTLYYVPNTINMYFVQDLIGQQGIPVDGYAYFPGGPDCIVIKKSSVSSPKVIPHEMGHFFGLYHTFETSLGLENINGSNCASAGDLVCDTPADPGGLNGANCQPNPYQQDAGGNWYVPQIGNTMSYYTDNCKCGFTTQQYNRMVAQFLASRNYLW